MVCELTHWPFSFQNASKRTIHFVLILRPFPANQWHAHRPESPPQQRHPSELFLGEPSTSPKHAGSDGQLLDHIKIGPFYVVGDDYGRLVAWKPVTAGDDYIRSIDAGEYDLDCMPNGGCDIR